MFLFLFNKNIDETPVYNLFMGAIDDQPLVKPNLMINIISKKIDMLMISTSTNFDIQDLSQIAQSRIDIDKTGFNVSIKFPHKLKDAEKVELFFKDIFAFVRNSYEQKILYINSKISSNSKLILNLSKSFNDELNHNFRDPLAVVIREANTLNLLNQINKLEIENIELEKSLTDSNLVPPIFYTSYIQNTKFLILIKNFYFFILAVNLFICLCFPWIKRKIVSYFCHPING